MYKNLSIITLLLTIILFVVLFFYEINIYQSGNKIINDNNETYLIFSNSYFQDRIALLIDDKIVNIKIIDIIEINNLKFYLIEADLKNLNQIIAVVERVNLLKYFLMHLRF
ncbi:MAG: hypothetical protein ACRCVI_02755 [Mycoplasmoidaceae bacterium]